MNAPQEPAQSSPGRADDGPQTDEEKALAALLGYLTDEPVTYDARDVGNAVIYVGAYCDGAGNNAPLHGSRIVAMMGPTSALAEQLDADGAPVWRHAGPLGEVIERLRELPRPGEPGAPSAVIGDAGALLRPGEL